MPSIQSTPVKYQDMDGISEPVPVLVGTRWPTSLPSNHTGLWIVTEATGGQRERHREAKHWYTLH